METSHDPDHAVLADLLARRRTVERGCRVLRYIVAHDPCESRRTRASRYLIAREHILADVDQTLARYAGQRRIDA